MLESTGRLAAILEKLTARARRRGWTDAEWARHVGLPKETLCRLRSRQSCDFRTLDALAWSVDATLDCVLPRRAVSADRLWPATVDVAYEDDLLDLVNAPRVDERRWRALGPPYFMAGVAVTLAGISDETRSAWLAFAEGLHPGVTQPDVYQRWLAQTPWPPVRWLHRVPSVAAPTTGDSAAV
jgi:hypothetical protein